MESGSVAGRLLRPSRIYSPEVIEESGGGRRLIWRAWTNDDADYSNYKSWKAGAPGHIGMTAPPRA